MEIKSFKYIIERSHLLMKMITALFFFFFSVGRMIMGEKVQGDMAWGRKHIRETQGLQNTLNEKF